MNSSIYSCIIPVLNIYSRAHRNQFHMHALSIDEPVAVLSIIYYLLLLWLNPMTFLPKMSYTLPTIMILLVLSYIGQPEKMKKC